MLLLSVDWSAIGAITGVAGFAITVGTIVGRTALHQMQERAVERKAAWEAEKERQEQEAWTKRAIFGGPATQYLPKSDGALVAIQQLTEAQGVTARAVTELDEEFHKHERERAAHNQGTGA